MTITQNEKPAGALLSARAHDAPTEQARFVAAVNEGLADVEAGRTHTHAEVVERMKQRFRRK